MLVTTELVRDVLCNELLGIDETIKEAHEIMAPPYLAKKWRILSPDQLENIAQHINNISKVLTSDDFQQVTDPDDVWLTELKEFCRQKRKEQ